MKCASLNEIKYRCEFYHNNTCHRLLQILFSAICAGRIRSSACSKYYSNDVITYRPGSKSSQRYSGGYCQSPEICAGCNDGFYAAGPYCRSEFILIEII